MIVSVMYQVGGGQKFDLDYYMKTHIPMVYARFGAFGLNKIEVLRGTGSPSGEAAQYHVIALLDFNADDGFATAVDAHGHEVMGDIPNFTDTQPTLQFNDRLG